MATVSKDFIVKNGIIVANTITSTNITTTSGGGGSLYLNGTSNRIDFNNSGISAPTFTTISTGTKIVLYPTISAGAVDYALGIENNTLWSSIPAAGNQFKWYAGTTAVASLSGTGTFSTTNLAYTGTLTGGTGVVAIGTNQIYKDASGNVGIGTSSPTAPLTIASSTGVAGSNSLIMFGSNNTERIAIFSSIQPCIIGNGFQGTYAVPVAVGSTNTLIDIQGRGYDGATYGIGGRINIFPEATWTTISRPATLVFSTTASGSTTITERIRITSAGGVSFGATGTAYGTSGQVLTSAGNAAPTWQTPTVGTVTSVAALTLGTTGTDVSSTVTTGTTTPVITLNIPTASATNRGALSSTDWSTFNGKQAAGSYLTVGGALGTPSSGTLTNCTFPTLNQNTAGTASNITAYTINQNVGTANAVQYSDITTARAAALTTGYMYYGNTGTKYAGFDGTNFVSSMPMSFNILGSSASCTGNAATSSSCTGNAATATTATNASYLNGTAQTSLFVGKVCSTVDINAANDTGSISVRGDTTYPACMSFHRGGAYAINVGLSNANNFVIGGWSASSNAFSMTGGGALTMLNNITAYSDERLKKNWRDLPVNFVERLADVKHGIYDRTDQECTQVGVSAQSLQPLLPDAIMTQVDGMLSVSYGNAALVSAVQLAKEVVLLKEQSSMQSNTIVLLIQAIKEQQVQIDELKQIINKGK